MKIKDESVRAWELTSIRIFDQKSDQSTRRHNRRYTCPGRSWEDRHACRRESLGARSLLRRRSESVLKALGCVLDEVL